jgi:hypothetical protein
MAEKVLKIKTVSEVAEAISGLTDLEGSLKGVGTAAFEAAAEFMRPDDLEGHVVMSADIGEHLERLQEFAELGFDEIYLHNVHRDQETFIRDFGAKVLPALVR